MECIFCKIAKKQIPARIVYENESCVGFLDINPRCKGMSIVIPKKHYTNFFDDPETSLEVFRSSEVVALKIKEALNPEKILFSILPAATPHFHIRIYPLINEKELPLIETKPIEVSEEELDALANAIRSVEVRIFEKGETGEKEEKKVERKKRKPEDVYWIRRELEIA